MALLGSGDKNASEIMSMVLGDFFRKCDSSTIIGKAILYECIRCISCILPNTKLFEVVISVTKEGVKFSTAGDIGTANIVLRQNTTVDFIEIFGNFAVYAIRNKETNKLVALETGGF